MGGNNLPQKQARTHQVGTTPSLPPSSDHFPTGLPSASSKPLIVTEEVQPSHINPAKVALKEPSEQRRRMESTRNTSETAPLCELGPPPAVTPPQPHPSRGVPGEAGSAAQTECRREGEPGERGRGQGRGAELQAAGFVQSGPGCQLGFLGGRSEAVDPKPARVRAEDPRGARADDPGPRPRSRVGRVPVPADSHPKHPERRVRPFPAAPPQAPRPPTVIVVAHFLLAASLTVRHGLGPPPPSRLRLLLRLLPPAAARRPDNGD